MPFEVKATPIAQRQIAGLRGPRRKAFDAFVTMLVNEGCRALAYRLTGNEPLPRLCVQHLRAKDRVVVAFEGPTAWVAGRPSHANRAPASRSCGPGAD